MKEAEKGSKPGLDCVFKFEMFKAQSVLQLQLKAGAAILAPSRWQFPHQLTYQITPAYHYHQHNQVPLDHTHQ